VKTPLQQQSENGAGCLTAAVLHIEREGRGLRVTYRLEKTLGDAGWIRDTDRTVGLLIFYWTGAGGEVGEQVLQKIKADARFCEAIGPAAWTTTLLLDQPPPNAETFSIRVGLSDLVTKPVPFSAQ
jgi:hypothetical protein